VANPGWSSDTLKEIHRDQGFALGLGALPQALEQLFHPQADAYLVVTTDEAARGVLGGWKVTGGALGVDTDEDGFVYVSVLDDDPGAGDVLIEFYRGPDRDDSPGNELVATAAGEDDDTLTIAPEAGYALAGTVKGGTFTASIDFALQLIVPPAKRMQHLFDGTRPFDQQIKERAVAALRSMRGAFAQARQQAQAFAEFVTRVEVADELVARTGDELLSTGITRNGTTGAYTENPQGLLFDVSRAQADNTTPVKAGAGVFAGSVAFPAWEGVASGLTYNQRAVPAAITWTLVKGLTGTAPEFQARRATTDRRRRPQEGQGTEVLDRPLRIGADWIAPEWGIQSLRIDYKAAIANVTSALLSTSTGDWSVSGLTSTNSTSGQVFARYDGSTLKFYATSAGRTAQDADDVVAQVALASSAVTTAFVAEGDSGLRISGKTGAGSTGALVTGSAGDVSFQAPVAGAYFTLEVTETTEVSEWVKRLRDGGVGGVSWRPNTGAGPNLLDGWIRAGLPLIHLGVDGARY